MVNWYAEMCAFGFAGLGASPFSEGNKSSSPSDNYENRTVIRGEALQLSQGPSKVPRAPHTPGFDAMLPHDQQTSSPKMDEMALRMLNVAPLLADFIVSIAHDRPDAAEKAFKLSYHWVFRCTGKVVMDIISHIDNPFWGYRQ